MDMPETPGSADGLMPLEHRVFAFPSRRRGLCTATSNKLIIILTINLTAVGSQGGQFRFRFEQELKRFEAA